MLEGKTEYLEMIQEPISRMSTISSIFKGFCATIVAGISLISYSTTSPLILGLSFLPVFSFAALDIYYLRLEKQFRYLFSQVANSKDQNSINFSLNPTIPKEKRKEAKATIQDCIKSPSIFLFYPLMVVIVLTVFILSCTGYTNSIPTL